MIDTWWYFKKIVKKFYLRGKRIIWSNIIDWGLNLRISSSSSPLLPLALIQKLFESSVLKPWNNGHKKPTIRSSIYFLLKKPPSGSKSTKLVANLNPSILMQTKIKMKPRNWLNKTQKFIWTKLIKTHKFIWKKNGNPPANQIR